VHYPTPIHRTEAYAPNGPTPTLLATEWLSARIVSLPMHPAMTVEEIEHIADAVHALTTLARAA
jgi:dTDP-4-amino-4,6-dideoxygalactose transaminase